MSDQNIFYVYEHWRPDTGVIFYVGKGHGKRAYCVKKRNKRHVEIVQTLIAGGFALQVRIVRNEMSEAEAFDAERQLITNWRSLGADLVNLTSGGQGTSGLSPSAEVRKRLSDLNKGKPSAFKGRKHKPETIAFYVQKGKAHGPPKVTPAGKAKAIAFHTGRKRSPETCQRISESLKGKPSWAKGKPSKLKGGTLSAETKERMRLGQKRKWERLKASGWINPRIGATCSEESRIKMTAAARKRSDHFRDPETGKWLTHRA